MMQFENILTKWSKRARWIVFTFLAKVTANQRFFAIVEDEQTRDKVFKFRYEVYNNELSRVVPGLKHELGIISDDYDYRPNTVIFYLEKNNEIICTIRAVLMDQQNQHPEILSVYNLSEYQWLKNYKLCELGRFIVNKKYRNSLTSFKFILTVIHHLVFQEKVRLFLLSCKPYLVDYYIFFGFTPYTKKFLTYPDGIEIPLIGIVDGRYLRNTKAVVKSTYAGIHTFDLNHLEILLASIETPIIDPSETQKLIEKVRPLVNDFPEQLIYKRLLSLGCYGLEITSKTKLIHKHMVDRTVFLILEGSVTVILDDHQTVELTQGQIVGEFSYYHPYGKRVADVNCENAKLLVMKQTVLQRFANEFPSDYIKLNKFVVSNIIKKFIPDEMT